MTQEQWLSDQLARLWFEEKEAWAERVGRREDDEFDTGLLKWRLSSSEDTFWRAIFSHILWRAKREVVEAEEFVKRLFGHGSAEEVLSYFRGS